MSNTILNSIKKEYLDYHPHSNSMLWTNLAKKLRKYHKMKKIFMYFKHTWILFPNMEEAKYWFFKVLELIKILLATLRDARFRPGCKVFSLRL
jgi:hypothetical protein